MSGQAPDKTRGGLEDHEFRHYLRANKTEPHLIDESALTGEPIPVIRQDERPPKAETFGFATLVGRHLLIVLLFLNAGETNGLLRIHAPHRRRQLTTALANLC
jgi:hypothetical protein